MTTLTITTRGQITLKHDLLKHLGVGPGDTIFADKLTDGRIVVKVAAPNGTISDFIGCLSQKGFPFYANLCRVSTRCMPSLLEIPAT